MCPAYMVSTAAATAVNGFDLLSQNTKETTMLRQSGSFRTIDSIGVTGGSAVSQFAIRVEVDGKFVGSYRNTTTGVYVPQPAKDIQILTKKIPIPPNAVLRCEVVGTPATNPVELFIEVNESAKKSYSPRRASGYSRARGRFRR